MNAPQPSSTKVLRRLFLTVFLRGNSSRGLHKEQAPKSIQSKLGFTLLMYAAIGLVALFFRGQPLFTLSLYLHGMTFVFVGMYLASSAGEVLFNKEEADILLHRPVTATALLWAKIAVLVQVSLWLAAAFNLAGLFVGLTGSSRSWLFPVAHALSTTLGALFCTGFVVLAYELCLRWFGRERLEGLMTTVQVIVAIVAVMGGQVAVQLIGRLDGKISLNLSSWWIFLMPPAWFAGVDDAISGSGSANSWLLTALGILVTAVVLWLAFVKLSRDYETGLQTLTEAPSAKQSRQGRKRWIPRLADAPPLKWWLRDSVSRASFLLTAAYLFRDRETKLRIYPGLAPILIIPVMMVLQSRGRTNIDDGSLPMAMIGSYLGLVALLGIDMLKYSQQWQASDLFRVAPVPGPARLCHGTRRAVLFFLTLPLTILLGILAWFISDKAWHLLMLLPGIISIPVYAMVGCLGGKAVPFSCPAEAGKAMGRGAVFIASTLIALLLAALVTWAWSAGWFWWLLLVELIAVTIIYWTMRASLTHVTWPPIE
jgi:ABC-2 type transport system permease protein